MSNMKSQFVGGADEPKSGGHADFLKASLGLMVAPAMTEQAKRDLAFMTDYVGQNPTATNTARFNGYVEKITKAHAEQQPALKTAPRSKTFGGGMM